MSNREQKNWYQLLNDGKEMPHDIIKVEGFINRDMADFLYGYVLLSKKRLSVIESIYNLDHIKDENARNEIEWWNRNLWGSFGDSQALGDYCRHGDLVFDTLLLGKLKQVKEITKMDLTPQYSYYRLYTKDAELKEHTDRESCEISVTLCLGYDSEYKWPIWFEDRSGKKISVEMNPGDMVVYKGAELKHWREPFKGNNHAQVFLHYTKEGKQDYKFDQRLALGLPSK